MIPPKTPRPSTSTNMPTILASLSQFIRYLLNVYTFENGKTYCFEFLMLGCMLFFVFLMFKFVQNCVCVFAMQKLSCFWRTEEGIKLPINVVKGICEPLNVDFSI